MSIRKAVIPAGGLGTRFLPTTKAVPKELLPVFDKPLIQYVVEEAVASGIKEVIFITSPGKEALQHYFEPTQYLELSLRDNISADVLEKTHQITTLAKFSYIEQSKPLGLGHAVLLAKKIIGNEPFVVLLPDDIFHGSEPPLTQMIDLYNNLNAGVIAVEKVPLERVSSYGIITPERINDNLYRVLGLVEKPSTAKAPSNFAIVGRYVLPPEIFDSLERTGFGANNEIQLTDALALLMKTSQLYAYRFSGLRLDGGTPIGLLKASLTIALNQENARSPIIETIRQLLQS